MAQALNGGRLTKEREMAEEFAEDLLFELVDMADITEHLERIEQEAACDVAAAAARLSQARNRHAHIKAELEQLKHHLTSDRMAVTEYISKAGFAHHVRTEARAAADGALLALAKRRNQA